VDGALKTRPGLAVQSGPVSLAVQVSIEAERRGLPSFYSSEFYDRSAVVTLAAAVSDRMLDVLAVFGRRTRARARVAAIGYHPSLLPLHRGRDALRWTIRDGDRVTGGSVYRGDRWALNGI